MASSRALLLLIPILLPGCASSHVFMEGVGPDGRTAPEVRHVLQSAAGNEGSVTVRLHGTRGGGIDGRLTDLLHIQLTVDNASADPVELPLAALLVTDDTQHALARIQATLPAGSPAEAALVGPHTRATADLLYDVGAPGALRTTGSILIEWTYRFRGQEARHTTRFLPVRYAHHHHVATTSWYVGPVWYGPAWCW